MIVADQQESAELEGNNSAGRKLDNSSKLDERKPVVRNNDNDDHSFEAQAATASLSHPARSCSTFGRSKPGGVGESSGHSSELCNGDGGAARAGGTTCSGSSSTATKDKDNKEKLGEQSIWYQPEMAAVATSEDNMTSCKRNKWASVEPEVEWQRQQQTSGRIGLMQIVESAERKLMMNKRAGGDQAARAPMLLLKSPAFATNTLDEAQLDSLASRPDDQDDDRDEDEDRDNQRDGPTPTNEFIRALLQRDRLALGARLAPSKPKLADTLKRQPHVKVTGYDGLAGASGCSAGPNSDDESTQTRRLDRELDKVGPPEVGLSALISKCRAIQLSSSTSSAPSDSGARLGRLMRPRTPSDPSPLVGATSRLTSAESGHIRRHSTYMLPLVLDDQRRRRQTKSRSGGLDTELSLTESSSSSPSPPPPPLETARQPAPSTAQHLTVRGLTSSLTNSSSSPSALSTPTNELEPSGCGGACCAVSNSPSLLNERIGVDSRTYKHQHASQSASSDDRSQPHTRTPSKVSQNTCMAANLLVRQLGTSKKASRMGASQAKSSSGKRHSIINILHSGNPQHLVSRFSHPRSLFSGSLSSSAGNSARNSLTDSLNSPSHLTTAGNSPTGRRPSHPADCKLADATSNSPEQQYDPLIPETGFKIVVMGTSGSGKSAIIKRFLYDTFDARHFATVEDTYFIEFPYMKNTINISISDTSGTYQFPAMRKLAINSGDAFILVYSVDDPKSFDDLEQLRQTILEERERACSEAPILSSCPSSSACSSSNLVSDGNAAWSTSLQADTGLDYHPLGPNNGTGKQYSPADQAIAASPSSRHWSLASLFGHNHANQTNLGLNYASHQQHPASSASSSVMGASSAGSSTTDSSRRSSISAAEAALKTRRTRRPPMVIVANKCDLPADQHLVNSDEIEALAVIDWNNGFVRASAKLSINVDDIFQQVLKQAKQPPTLTEAIVSKRRRSLPPKLPNQMLPGTQVDHNISQH